MKEPLIVEARTVETGLSYTHSILACALCIVYCICVLHCVYCSMPVCQLKSSVFDVCSCQCEHILPDYCWLLVHESISQVCVYVLGKKCCYRTTLKTIS